MNTENLSVGLISTPRTRLAHAGFLRSRLLRPLLVLCALLAFGYWWGYVSGEKSAIVLYFGRPYQIGSYVEEQWPALLLAGVNSFATAIASLVLAGATAMLLLAFGMMSDGRLARIERAAAFLQTIPTLVVVTVALLFEREFLTLIGFDASPDLFCIIPVALSLIFAPLVNGIGAVTRASVNIKAILRMWDAPPWWRVWRVYLPYAAAEVLTGLRASATWAVGAVLIAEGLVNGVSGDVLTLGHALIRPFSTNPPGQTPAVIIISVILGFAVYWVTAKAQQWIERVIYGRIALDHQSYPLQSRSRRLRKRQRGSK